MVPANNRDWPQGEFYGFDRFYDSRNVGYEGPRFGYPTMPDQYTLDAVPPPRAGALAAAPVMAEIDLITSHAPWSRMPRLIDQAAVGDGSVFEGMPEQLPSEGDIWPDPERVQAAYGDAIEYSLGALVRFVTTYGDDDLVLVVLGRPPAGDHRVRAGRRLRRPGLRRGPGPGRARRDRRLGVGRRPPPGPGRAGLADGRRSATGSWRRTARASRLGPAVRTVNPRVPAFEGEEVACRIRTSR